MKGSEFVKALSNNLAKREDQIFNALTNGGIYWEWTPVEFEFNGHTVSMSVTSDVIAVGTDKDHVRVNVSANLTKRIREHFNLAPITARLSDRIFDAGTLTLAPQTQPPDHATRIRKGYSSEMHDVGAMVASDAAITRVKKAAVNAGGCPTLVVGCFKWWIATQKKRVNRVANYGYYWAGGNRGTLPHIRLIQTVMYGHHAGHTDYSQYMRGIINEFFVKAPDGTTTAYTFEELAAHPTLHPIVSHEGVMSHFDELPVAKKLSAPQAPERSQRMLRFGMVGSDVGAWQQTLGLFEDGRNTSGVFDAETLMATKVFQRAHGLKPDGVVGPLTLAAATDNKHIDDRDWDDTIDIDMLPFVEAVNYNRVHRTDIRQIVIHDMEAPKTTTIAEGVANYFAGKSGKAPMASAHVNVDNDSAVMSVPWSNVAYHAKKGNRYGIGIEHAGYARQTREEWLDDYGMSMLWLSAQITAQLCIRYNIPVRFLTETQVRNHERGITTHKMITKAFKVVGGHYDPGKHFPEDVFLELVRRAVQLR